MQDDFLLILQRLASEQPALTALNRFLKRFGADNFHALEKKYKLIVSVDRFETRVMATLLWKAVTNNDKAMVKRLIELGVNINDGLTSETDRRFHNQSPLMSACEFGHFDCVRILLDAGASLLHRSSIGFSVLMKARSKEMCHLILEEAKKRHCCEQLTAFRTEKNHTAYDFSTNNTAVILLTYECELFFIGIMKGTEESALESLDRFISICGLAHLPVRLSLPRWEESILSFAVRNNYIDFAAKLLACGASIEEGVIRSDDMLSIEKGSPLSIACKFNHTNMIRLLIQNGANMCHVTATGLSVLMLASSPDTVRYLLDESRERGCLMPLISLKTKKFQSNAYEFHCDLGHAEIVNILMCVEGYLDHIDSKTFLNRSRIASWKYPEQCHEFNEICLRLRAYNVSAPVIPLTANQGLSVVNGKRMRFFAEDRSLMHPEKKRKKRVALSVSSNDLDARRESDKASIKQQAIKSAITQFSRLLASPEGCFHYLKQLNDELSRYYFTKHGQAFPALDPSSYDFQVINDLFYPIPKEGYQGICKKSALQELLITIFRKYGLAKNAYKWIGFIPHGQADAQMRQGDFSVESRLGTGLFHGKLSHMIQQLILIFAIEEGEIDRTFDTLGETHTLSMADIIDGFISLETDDGSENLWSQVRDTRTFDKILFSDPYRLNSVIMHDGRAFGCNILADSMIDTFCKGYIKFKAVYCQSTPFSELGLDEFTQHMDDLLLYLFIVTPKQVEIDIQQSIGKRPLALDSIDHSERYAIIPTKYHLDDGFKSGDISLSARL